MNVVSSECIILKRADFGERDRLVTFLARDKGRMSGIAKGARTITRRGVGSYEPFNRGHIFYVEKPSSDLVAIRKVDLVPPYLYLHNDYTRYLYASYFTELMLLVPIPPPEADAFFTLLAEGLQRVYEADDATLPVERLGYELRFLHALGLQPTWHTCGVCARPVYRRTAGGLKPVAAGPYQLDAALGAVRCPDCAGQAPLPTLSPGTLAFLAAWWLHPGGARVLPTRQALGELEAALTQHLVHHLEREPCSLALLPDPTGARHREG